MILLILPRNNCAAVIHDGGWAFKFITVFILFTVCFWIPIGFFKVWADISRYVSILFMILQTLYILVGAYGLGEYMVNTMSNDDTWRNGTLLVYTIVLSLISIALFVTSFIWFISGSGCGANLTFIIITLVMFFLVFGLRCRKTNSIFTAAMVNVWLVYMLWSALASEPSECNSLRNSSGATFF